MAEPCSKMDVLIPWQQPSSGCSCQSLSNVLCSILVEVWRTYSCISLHEGIVFPLLMAQFGAQACTWQGTKSSIHTSKVMPPSPNKFACFTEVCRHLVGSSCMPVYNQLVELVPHHVMEEGRSSELC
jgi:hypothetical protein